MDTQEVPVEKKYSQKKKDTKIPTAYLSKEIILLKRVSKPQA